MPALLPSSGNDFCGSRAHSILQCGPVPSPPPGHSWESLMDAALGQARKAALGGEVPVGALVVSPEGRILSQAHNAPVQLHDPSAHAEILALRQAGAVLGNYRLEHCVLVVTLEPCLMCTGALIHARVEGVVFGAADRRAGAIISCLDGLAQNFHNHRPWHMGGICSAACAGILRTFFRSPGVPGAPCAACSPGSLKGFLRS